MHFMSAVLVNRIVIIARGAALHLPGPKIFEHSRSGRKKPTRVQRQLHPYSEPSVPSKNARYWHMRKTPRFPLPQTPFKTVGVVERFWGLH